MKVLVPIKRVADPANANKVKVAGSEVSHDGLEWVMNPFDEWSLEAALRLTEDASAKTRTGEIVVVSIGPKAAVDTLREAMGKGAERGVLVDGEDTALDSNVVAQILAKVVEKEQPDLVLMGKQSADGDSNIAGTKLAELLGWPVINYASHIETSDDGKTLTIKRELDVGVQTLKVQGPAVITCSDRILKPGTIKNGVTPADFEYPDLGDLNSRLSNLKNIMAARKKPLDELGLGDLGVEPVRVDEYVGFELPAGRSGQAQFLESVDELVQKLQSEAKVL
ncbi:MAG: electron transfer flavoprotein subunit beta/FixA family protein [Myxococcales bacterium]|nr:electron transfer flavoprotein subunit beta/FixA family protein [Myxococcales bacterium]